MKGVGRTVMKGTKIETFQAEVLGVLKNTSPGRDMVLCRLSGLNLEKTGVIAGMSGSPVYIDGKLLGAVAYAWAFGKEPIAGVTPFSQMHGFVEAFEKRDHGRVGPMPPTPHRPAPAAHASTAASSTPSPSPHGFDEPQADGRRPVDDAAADAAGRHRLHAAQPGAAAANSCGGTGLVPMQGGGVGRQASPTRRRTSTLEPGGPLSVALITGDFDLSGIGTVTHIEGDRVYGWGHPFMGLGACEFPLMTGYIHTIYPRQTVSFKMGSPLRTVGVINADVSTCIAGWLGRKPDLLPVRHDGQARRRRAGQTFNVEVVRAAVAAGRAGLHGADQLRRHGGRAARGADGRAEGADRDRGPASRSSSRTPSPARCYSGGRGAGGALSARSAASSTMLTYNPYRAGADQAHRVRDAS